MPACLQAMGWALLFIASAGTGAAGLLLCVVMGVMYTLGFILASAGKLGFTAPKSSESDYVGLTGFVDFLSGEMLTVKADSTMDCQVHCLTQGTTNTAPWRNVNTS